MEVNRNKNKIAIIGTGAQMKYALETFSCCSGITVWGVVQTGSAIDEKIRNDLQEQCIRVIKDFSSFRHAISVEKDIQAIVCLADNSQKEEYIDQLQKLNIPLANAVHPGAIIAKTASIGENVMINAGAVIHPYAYIGNGVMIHAQVDVEHDCIVEDFVNLAPGVKLAGWVIVKKGAVVYTNACVIPCLTIGSGSIVGAGSVVIKDIPENVTVVGNPARILEKMRNEET